MHRKARNGKLPLALFVWIVFVSILFAPVPLVSAEASPARAAGGSVSFTPTGRVSNNVAFKMTFADAIVSQETVGNVLPVADFPFVVTPQIQAEGKWLDQRTFSASLLAPLEMSTSYAASVKDGLKTLKGRTVPERRYVFQTDPLSLLSVRAAWARNSGIDVQLDFNAPVSPSRLRGFLTIGSGNGHATYHLSGVASKTLHAFVPMGDMSRTIDLNVRVAAGLTGETGTLGLEKEEVRRLELKPVLRVEGLVTYNDNSGVYVDTNLAVDVDVLASFIEVEPKVSFTPYSHWDSRIRLQGDFKPRERYVFTFKKGLPAKNGGVVLEQDHTQAVIMPDLSPSIEFPAAGMFLSPIGGGRIPVELVNVRNLRLGLWRLYENNLPYAMRGDYSYFRQDLARRVASKEFQLSLPLNEKARRSISIDELVSADGGVGRRGLFLLTLSNPDDDYWNERSQIVNLSDMGAAVRLWEDGILVWVNTLSTIEPVVGANVRVYSSANQLLAEGRTGMDGVWHLRRGQVWETDDRTPSFVTISKSATGTSPNDATGQDITFVRLTRGLLSQEVFDTSGRPWLRSGYDASIFSARDIYRTSERVPFKAVVRGHDLSTPESFPVLFVVRDPLGRTVKRGTSLLSEEGGALFELELPHNALTGKWDASLFVPGDESRALAVMHFSVEDFAPPRIEVKLTTDAKWLTFEDSGTPFDISARYLFGVDGAGLKWEASWRARRGSFVPKQDKWRSYTFDDDERKFFPVSDAIHEGTLNGEGKGSFELSLMTDDWRAPVIDVTVAGAAMEEGGRWVSDSVTLPYYPSRWLLGLTAPEGVPAVGKELKFRVAAITPDEEPADPDELTATFYRVTWNYNLVELDGYTRWQSTEEFSKVASKPVTVKDGVAEVTFKPEIWGTYRVQVSDARNNASASVRFYADDPEYAGGGSQLLDRVEIELDKERYKVGDVAKVTLRSPFEGLLLFDVEAMGLVDRKIVKVDKAEAVLEVPITEQMIPNAWCAAWLIRPVTENEAWGAHRAIGIKRIDIDLDPHRLVIGIDAPAKIEPATKLPVTLTLTDAGGNPAKGELALALVDDGVLGLTNFKTPDLMGRFLGQRRMNSDGYDIYDLLVPVESRSTELLHPSGGASLSAFAAANGAKRFKILSLFDGLLSADETGVVKTELELPEFSGRGRVFAVGTSGARFGMAEQTVQIARDLVAEMDLPRFATPGDVFIVPLTVYNSSATSKDVTVELSTSGELSFEESFGKTIEENQGSLKASIPSGASRKWEVALKAKSPGTAIYSVKTSWKEGDEEKTYEQSIDMPVRSPFPVVTLSGSGFFESGDAKIEIAKDAFAAPVAGKIVLADTPLVDLTKATSFLAAYPYGCLEQTLSAAWPFLVLPDAISEIDPLLIDSRSVKLKTDAALARIQTMQLYDGSFAKWPGWGTPYNWGSVYAAHFLVEARKAGVDYPEEMLKGVLNWLRQFLASIPGSSSYRYQIRDDFTTKAYAAYVLALNGEKPLGWLHYLKENTNEMWPSGRIWLAGAYALVEGRADALRELGNWSGNETLAPEALYETLDSNVRNAAQLLSIWSEAEPRSMEAMRLVQLLLDWGRQNLWYSTQENAAAAMALGRYLVRAGYEKGQLEGVLTDGEREVASFRSGEKSSIEISAVSSSPTLRVTGSGNGYYSWSVTGTPLTAPKPDRKGLLLECVWKDDKGDLLALDQPIAQGTKISVTLSLTPSVSISDVAVSYLLPAGMEIENPRLQASEGTQEGETQGVYYDVRDDRLLLFVDRLSQKADYSFEMRAVTRGDFAVPPLSAEGMYNPGVRFVGAMGENVTIE
ncbi:MAG: hypothetical protein LBQ42_10320 [Synergistaceae bacterium]|jgi:uncharacterized protein YfaS (alpha-2-macroglobulin family)|nr:hypothetical protein [Synergistaceae bacterium]